MNTKKLHSIHHAIRSRAGLHRLRWLCIAATVALVAVPPTFAGTWTPLAHTAPSTIGHMLLLADGTVMAEKDDDNGTYGPVWYRLTPDASGSYVNGTWTTLASMINTRLFFASQVLMDGRVFVAGGEYGSGGAAGEIYNPLTNAWTQAPAPGHTLSDADLEILPDGRVLVAVVDTAVSPFLRTTLLFDPVANSWATGPTCNGIHNESAWVKLPDDSILFVDRDTTNSERYIPASNTWMIDATAPVSLYDPYGSECGPGMLLPNGKVIFFGATGHTAIYTPSGSTANGTWVVGPDFPNGQAMPDAPCAMMPNGNILCATAPIPISGNVFQSPTSFYEYNYVTNSFTQVNAPAGGTTESGSSFQRDMLLLPNGTVLSSRFTNQLYVYAGGGTPVAGAAPAITSVTQNVDGSYHLVGTFLNGISAGAYYGDDNQDSTNRPIVRLTSGSNVYYVSTYNWSSTSVATGSTPLTTEFSVPANVPAGNYSLVAIANGIASPPVPFSYTLPPSSITPHAGLASNGPTGGPFTPNSVVYTLTNNSAAPLNWTAAKSQNWVSLSATGGTLGAGASIQITVSINSAANALSNGAFADTVTITDTTNNAVFTRGVSLQVHYDYFTELFASNNDTSNQSWLFTPNGSGSFYGVQHIHVTAFPTDPTGGTTLSLTDDSFSQVTLTGGVHVLLYGVSYTSFYVGSNGYITFNSGDTTYIESLSAHFSQPRIAALFRDLNPGSAGTVSWKQLADRVAVTWQNVPEYSIANSNNFQVELFFDGRIRITCLGIASTGGLIGLSRGQGVPSDFGPSDFDTYLSSNANLANLALSAGTLTPVFSSATTSYTAGVSYANTSITVTPTAADTTATVTVNGVAVASGSPSSAINLAIGSNSIPTVVTAQDGITTQTYTLTVTRAVPTPGGLDPNFGTGGIVTTPIGSGNEQANSVAVQSDGKIVAAGQANIGGNDDFALVRYKTDGTLDTINFGATGTTFTGGGKVTTPIGSGNDRGYSVALQGDGKIVVAGASYNGANDDFAVVRYNTDGTLDTTNFGATGTTFTGGGKVTTDFNGHGDDANGITLQSDGKIVVAGTSYTGSTNEFALVRYNPDGTLDTLNFGSTGTTFTGGGKVLTAIGTVDDSAFAVALDSLGRILVGGYSKTASQTRFCLVRYNTDGTLDTNFNGTGEVTTTFSGATDQIRGIAVQADGKIVAAGGTVAGGHLVVAVARYNTDGSLDQSFGSGGKVTTVGYGYSVALQSDGKIVVAGSSSNGSNQDFAVVRYNTNGTPDTSFNGTGKVTTPIGSSNEEAYAMAIQPDGNIVAAGYSYNGFNNDFALVRYFGFPLPVQLWRQIWYGTPSNIGNAADSADPYNRHVQNLAAFAFGGPNQNPAQASASLLPVVQNSGGNLFFGFTQPSGVSGITYGAEWSMTLQTNDWHAITDTGSAGQHLFSVPIGSNTMLFIRLKLSDP